MNDWQEVMILWVRVKPAPIEAVLLIEVNSYE